VSKGKQSVLNTAYHKIIQKFFVVLEIDMQLIGNSEDTMEVLDGEQIELPIKDPFLFVYRLA